MSTRQPQSVVNYRNPSGEPLEDDPHNMHTGECHAPAKTMMGFRGINERELVAYGLEASHASGVLRLAVMVRVLPLLCRDPHCPTRRS